MTSCMRANSVGKFSRIAAISVLCFCGGSQAQQPPQPQTATSPEKGGATRAAGGVTKSVSESGSSVTVACESPIELLVDRKSTRLNSSHQIISYAVFCL